MQSWRRQWQPTPVLLPGKSHGWRSLGGYNSWDRKELDATERLHFLSFHSSFGRRKQQPTPAVLPGESHGWRGLVGCSLWGCKESDMTKQLTHTYTHTRCSLLFWQYSLFKRTGMKVSWAWDLKKVKIEKEMNLSLWWFQKNCSDSSLEHGYDPHFIKKEILFSNTVVQSLCYLITSYKIYHNPNSTN